MVKYQIIKKMNINDEDYQLRLHPPVDGDFIYEFATLKEATLKLDKIKDLEIYKNVKLSVIAVDY